MRNVSIHRPIRRASWRSIEVRVRFRIEVQENKLDFGGLTARLGGYVSATESEEMVENSWELL
jgi:hypothetical protein